MLNIFWRSVFSQTLVFSLHAAPSDALRVIPALRGCAPPRAEATIVSAVLTKASIPAASSGK